MLPRPTSAAGLDRPWYDHPGDGMRSRWYLWYLWCSSWSPGQHGRTAAPPRRRQRAPWWTPRVFLLGASLSVLACGVVPAWAQERLGVEPPRRPGLGEPSFPEERVPPVLPRPVLPALPPPAPEEPARLSGPHVFVRQITVTGSTVFSEDALAAVTAPYVHREVTSEELEALRLALTRLYINAGYINSGAVLPDQTVTEGVVTYQIIEGELTSVTLEGHRWFRERYLRQRLTLDVEPPLSIGTLQERLQRLQQDDRIARLEAELRPGVQLGESTLHVRVEERLPVFVALEFNNYQSPTVGAEQGLITVAERNLTGHGDILSVTYGRSSGLNPQLDASYTLPVSPRETTFGLRYRRNNASVVEATFAPLDIQSLSES